MSEEFEALQAELEHVLRGLDERQTQLRPKGDPARWSIQQIMGHLLLTYKATKTAVEARTAKGSPTKATPTLAQRAGQLMICEFGYFPRGRVAPAAVTADKDEAAVPGAMLVAQAASAIGCLDRRIAEAEKVFGPKQRAISHMVLGPLSVTQWRRFHLTHGRHHMKQIAAIRAEYGV